MKKRKQQKQKWVDINRAYAEGFERWHVDDAQEVLEIAKLALEDETEVSSYLRTTDGRVVEFSVGSYPWRGPKPPEPGRLRAAWQALRWRAARLLMV